MTQKRQAEIQDGGWFHTVLITFWPMSNTIGSQAAMLLRSSSTEPNRSSAWAVVRCCMYERFTSIVWQQQGHILSPNSGLQRVLNRHRAALVPLTPWSNGHACALRVNNNNAGARIERDTRFLLMPVSARRTTTKIRCLQRRIPRIGQFFP